MAIRPLGAVYVLVMLLLSIGLGVAGGYIAVSGYPLIGVPVLAIAAIGVCHTAIIFRWLRTPARVRVGTDGLWIASPAVVRSELFVPWGDIELARVRFGVSSLPADTVVLAPLAVPVDVFLRLSADVSPDARRWLGLLVEPMGSRYGRDAQMPRPGRYYRRLAFTPLSHAALTNLEAELRSHHIPVSG